MYALVMANPDPRDDPLDPGLDAAMRFHGPGESDEIKGDGKGVISTIGPSDGDENAEPGDNDPARVVDADNAAFTLGVRCGPVMGGGWEAVCWED
jgi:hypothetical protein